MSRTPQPSTRATLPLPSPNRNNNGNAQPLSSPSRNSFGALPAGKHVNMGRFSEVRGRQASPQVAMTRIGRPSPARSSSVGAPAGPIVLPPSPSPPCPSPPPGQGNILGALRLPTQSPSAKTAPPSSSLSPRRQVSCSSADGSVVQAHPIISTASASQPSSNEASCNTPSVSRMVSTDLEPVHEETEKATEVSASTVQELKEQLRTERAWWQNTSAAQVTQQMGDLQKDMQEQQVTLAKIAQHILNPSGMKLSIDETPQMQAVQVSLDDLKRQLKHQQEAQEIHANALREGLMEIHEQRASLTVVEKRVKEQEHSTQSLLDKLEKDLDSLTAPRTGSESAVMSLEAEDRLKELTAVVQSCTGKCGDLSKAIEYERDSRIDEAMKLRRSLDDYRPPICSGSNEHEVQLSSELRRLASVVDAEPWVARTTKLSDEVQRLTTVVDERFSDIVEIFQASRTAEGCQHQSTQGGQATAPSLQFEQVKELIQDAQEMLRFEFSARLSEVEVRIREAGKMPSQPRADADELATRLEAIKAQLRTEIEKRIETSPQRLVVEGLSHSKLNPVDVPPGAGQRPAG